MLRAAAYLAQATPPQDLGPLVTALELASIEHQQQQQQQQQPPPVVPYHNMNDTGGSPQGYCACHGGRTKYLHDWTCIMCHNFSLLANCCNCLGYACLWSFCLPWACFCDALACCEPWEDPKRYETQNQSMLRGAVEAVEWAPWWKLIVCSPIFALRGLLIPMMMMVAGEGGSDLETVVTLEELQSVSTLKKEEKVDTLAEFVTHVASVYQATGLATFTISGFTKDAVAYSVRVGNKKFNHFIRPAVRPGLFAGPNQYLQAMTVSAVANLQNAAKSTGELLARLRDWLDHDLHPQNTFVYHQEGSNFSYCVLFTEAMKPTVLAHLASQSYLPFIGGHHEFRIIRANVPVGSESHGVCSCW